METAPSSIDRVRLSYPDFQVEIVITMTEEEHFSDIQLIIDGLMALISPIQDSPTVLEDTISIILVGREQVKTCVRSYKVAHFPTRNRFYVSGKGWK